MAQFNKGDKVAQIVNAPISGVVTDYALDSETGEVLIKVSYTDAQNNPQERHFRQTELQAAA